MATKTTKYDPKGKFIALTRITHPEATNGRFEAGESGFTMSHRTPEQVEYLVDVIKAIAPMEAKAGGN